MPAINLSPGRREYLEKGIRSFRVRLGDGPTGPSRCFASWNEAERHAVAVSWGHVGQNVWVVEDSTIPGKGRVVVRFACKRVEVC